MTLDGNPTIRSATITITRHEFFGLCEAQLALATCREQLEQLVESRSKPIRTAARTALEQLQQAQIKLKATTGG